MVRADILSSMSSSSRHKDGQARGVKADPVPSPQDVAPMILRKDLESQSRLKSHR